MLNRAYSVQKRPLPFPLTDLKRMLKFESEQEVGSRGGRYQNNVVTIYHVLVITILSR